MRFCRLPILLGMLALTFAPALGRDEQPTECHTFAGLLPGGRGPLLMRARTHEPGLTGQLTLPEDTDLALLHPFPNPLANYEGPIDLKFADDVGFPAFFLTKFPPGTEPLIPFFTHYHRMLPSYLSQISDNDRTARKYYKAVRNQLKWILAHPKAAYVPPLATFVDFGYGKTVTKLYRKKAMQLGEVPISRTDADGFSVFKPLPSQSGNAPRVIEARKAVLVMNVRAQLGGLLESQAFTSYARRFLDSTHTPPETAIAGMVKGFRTELFSNNEDVNRIQADLASGKINPSDLAAYFAFYLPEITQQALIFEKLTPNRRYLFDKWTKSGGYDPSTGRSPIKLSAKEMQLAEREAEGWNMRNPEAFRPAELALSYLHGEKTVEVAKFEALVSPELPAPAPTAPTGPELIYFTSAPPQPLGPMPQLEFAKAGAIDFILAPEPLMMAHLGITGALHSAREKFRTSEAKQERPAIEAVEAFLKKKDRSRADFPAVEKALKDLLALNTSKLTHLEAIKGQSTELVRLMGDGLSTLEGTAGTLPAVEGASQPIVEKINAVLQSRDTLRSVALNATSVDLSLNELQAKLISDRATLLNVVRILGNPQYFDSTPDAPLIQAFDALAHDGH